MLGLNRKRSGWTIAAAVIMLGVAAGVGSMYIAGSGWKGAMGMEKEAAMQSSGANASDESKAGDGAPRPGARTAVPIYGLIGKNENDMKWSGQGIADAELADIARDFAAINDHWLFSKEQTAKLHKLNPNLILTNYRNGTYNEQNTDEYKDAERQFPLAITMYRAGELVQSVTANADSLVLSDASRLKATRAATGEYSTSTKDTVHFLRLDDELVRIEAIEKPQMAGGIWKVKVKRGIWGTKPAPHEQMANVLAPLYIGSAGEFAGFPDGKGERLRYGLRIELPEVQQWLYSKVKEIVDNGYDGAWLDITNSNFYNMGDASGKAVVPWSFDSGKEYTRNEMREHQMSKINYLKKQLTAEYGPDKWLTANGLKRKNYWETSDGQENRLYRSPINAASIELFAAGGPEGWLPVKEWVDEINMLNDTVKNGHTAIAWAKLEGGAKVDKAKYERFAYGSFLLAYRPEVKSYFMVQARNNMAHLLGGSANGRQSKLSEMYFWQLGAPLTKTNEVSELLAGERVYARKFENGTVYVNPSGQDELIKLEEKLYDTTARTWVTEVKVAAHDMKLMLAK